MKFLLDENVDHRLLPFLSSLGYDDVTTIGDDYPPSLPDVHVLAIAYREQRILLTHDHTDFGELIFRRHHPHCGVILFRLKAQAPNIQLVKERLHFVLSHYVDQLQSFIVVTSQRIRVHEAKQKQAA